MYKLRLRKIQLVHITFGYDELIKLPENALNKLKNYLLEEHKNNKIVLLEVDKQVLKYFHKYVDGYFLWSLK